MEKTGALVKKLDTVFKRFIRLRDSKAYGFIAFMCISCGKVKRIENSKGYSNYHAGHYYHGTHGFSLRWDEKNVNGQCSACNTHKHGAGTGYAMGLVRKYGSDILNLLEAKKKNFWKPLAYELKALIDEYTIKVEQLEQEKERICGY